MSKCLDCEKRLAADEVCVTGDGVTLCRGCYDYVFYGVLPEKVETVNE